MHFWWRGFTDLTVHISDELVAQLGGKAAHEKLEHRAVDELRANGVNECQLRKMLGLGRIELDGFLKGHGIYQKYTIEDFEKERRALNALAF